MRECFSAAKCLFAAIFLAFSADSPAFAQEPTPNADLNRDGVIDSTDLLILMGQWHEGEAFTETPVPATPTSTPTPSLSHTASVTPTGTRPTPPPGEITINLPNLPPGAKPLTLVRIPAGSFQMGRYPGEVSSDPDEDPQHEVNIGYDFYMGKWEVTQAQWLAVMGSWPVTPPSPTSGVGDDYPAYGLSWDDCKAFIAALNALGQGTFRLPSEAEWEYACRAGTATRFHFGDSLGCDNRCEDCAAGILPGNRTHYMWYCGNNSPSGTKIVGQKLPNAFGLFDMHGNVYECCEDDYHSSYTGAPTDGSAWVDAPRGGGRIVRGGFWDGYGGDCRSAERDVIQTFYGWNFGVRLLGEAP